MSTCYNSIFEWNVSRTKMWRVHSFIHSFSEMLERKGSFCILNAHVHSYLAPTKKRDENLHFTLPAKSGSFKPGRPRKDTRNAKLWNRVWPLIRNHLVGMNAAWSFCFHHAASIPLARSHTPFPPSHFTLLTFSNLSFSLSQLQLKGGNGSKSKKLKQQQQHTMLQWP